jgi:hypothetical protein
LDATHLRNVELVKCSVVVYVGEEAPGTDPSVV